MTFPAKRIIGGVLIPLLVMLPFFALSMAVNSKRELDTWMPAPSVALVIRVLFVMYVVFVTAHLVYGTIVTLVARWIHLNHSSVWTAIYVGPLAFFFSSMHGLRCARWTR